MRHRTIRCYRCDVPGGFRIEPKPGKCLLYLYGSRAGDWGGSSVSLLRRWGRYRFWMFLIRSEPLVVFDHVCAIVSLHLFPSIPHILLVCSANQLPSLSVTNSNSTWAICIRGLPLWETAFSFRMNTAPLLSQIPQESICALATKLAMGIKQPSTSLHTWGPPCVFENNFNSFEIILFVLL